MPRQPLWHALAEVTAAVLSTDASRVQTVVAELGGTHRWLSLMAYAAGTVAIVLDGILLLLRNWRLTLLQLVPATWIYWMSRNLRTRMLAHQHPPRSSAPWPSRPS